jgi:hypothetical protein
MHRVQRGRISRSPIKGILRSARSSNNVPQLCVLKFSIIASAHPLPAPCNWRVQGSSPRGWRFLQLYQASHKWNACCATRSNTVKFTYCPGAVTPRSATNSALGHQATEIPGLLRQASVQSITGTLSSWLYFTTKGCPCLTYMIEQETFDPHRPPQHTAALRYVRLTRSFAVY